MSILNVFLFDSLSYPAVLLLLAGVGVLLFAELGARAPGAIGISTGDTLAGMPRSPRAWRRHVPAVLRAIGLALLIFALAGPLNGYQVRKDRANVIDILLCVDVSGSMTQRDFVFGGRYVDRLFVTKAAVRDFIDSRKERSDERFGLDRLGLVLYAGIAWTQCPLTLDYGILERELERAEVETQSSNKDGTAIGSAIGLAVRRLSQSEAKSKVIVLLTDGINNRGELDPITAAQVAKEYDMRVYTIGAGAAAGVRRGFMGQSQPIDEGMLTKIADITGGKYYRAADTDALQEAYAEINALEATEIDIGDYYEYKEAFMPYAILGMIALIASVVSRRQWFEVIP